jgi:hypothetical protein
MPYSKKHNCFFFHITKTGGTSVEKAMGIYRDKTPPEGKTLSLFGHNRQHFTYSILNHFDMIDDEMLDSCICFTVIRNPIDRLVSEYFWLKRHKKTTFKNFVTNEYLPKYRKAKNDIIKQHRHAHFFPQYVYECDFISDYLTFENLQEDWKIFIDKYDLNLPDVLPHEKKSQMKKYDGFRYYDYELLKLVKTEFKKDIEFYEKHSWSLEPKK